MDSITVKHFKNEHRIRNKTSDGEAIVSYEFRGTRFFFFTEERNFRNVQFSS